MGKDTNLIEKSKKQTMKEIFKGYSKYSDKEYKEIWEQAIIVVDTNILLNFYRFSNETRSEIYEVLNSLKKRLWIPYQVAYEYFKNKEKVIVDANDDFDKLSDEAQKCFNTIIDKVKQQPSKRLKCKDELLKELSNSQEKIKKIILDDKTNNKDKASEEKIEGKIFGLFDNSIGTEIIGEEYENMKQEGIRRVKEELPPGYKDKTKEENGDYYIFYSMMKYAKENKKHIIFMTDDVKEDWFIRRFGEIKSGDYRILNEFYKETGKLLLIYTSDGFIKAYQKNIKDSRTVDDKVIDELVATRSENYDSEVLLSPSIYIKRIQNILRKLFHYDVFSINSTLRNIDILRELLIEINVFDNTTSTILNLLVSAIRRKNTTHIKMILEELKERIYSNPMFNKRIENDYIINDIKSNYNYVIKNEDNSNIYEKASEMFDKIGKITNEEKKSIIIDKMMMILNKINNSPYLTEFEKIKINNEMNKLYSEIENELKESMI